MGIEYYITFYTTLSYKSAHLIEFKKKGLILYG